MENALKKENELAIKGFYIIESEDYLDLELFFYSLAFLLKDGYVYIEFSNNEILNDIEVVKLDRNKIIDASELCGKLSKDYLLINYSEFLYKGIYKKFYYGPILNIYFFNKQKKMILQWCDVGKNVQIFIDLSINEESVRNFCKNIDIYSYCVELEIE